MTLAARLLPRLILGGSLAAGLVACGTAAPTASPASPATSTPAATLATAPSPIPSAPPTAAPTAAAGATACGVADLKASHGLVDGAAGSMFTEVVLVSDTDCTIETSPSLGLQDKSGSALVTAAPAGAGSIQLVAGDAYTSQVRLANWCDPEPAFPLALILWIDSEKLVVTGGSFPEDGMPGCLGTGGVRLEATPWVASP
jgi:hypothetical protein